MPRYTAPLTLNLVGISYKTMGALWTGGTTRRMAIYELDVGQSGVLNTSTDTQLLYDVSRFTTTSLFVGTSVVPSPLDGGDGVSLAVFNNNATTEFAALAAAGSGLNLLNPPINQRGTFRWRALDDGDNIIIPNTAQAGIAVRTLSAAYIGSANGTIMYLE